MSSPNSYRPKTHIEFWRLAGRARNRGARAASSGRRRRWLHRLGVAVNVFLIASGTLWLALDLWAPATSEDPAVRGVHLGMTVNSTRAAFVDGGAGRWSTAPGCDATALEWSRAEGHATPTRWARFEFHDGFLVAIRVLSDPERQMKRHVAVTKGAVFETRPGADGSKSTTALARGCDTHGAEVQMLMASTEE